MAGEISKQDQALARGATLVREAKTDLDSQLKNLSGKLDAIRGQWVGQGAVAFNNVMQRWNEDAKKIVAALTEFEANLTASEKAYAESDEQQQQAFQRLSGRLG